MSIRRVSFAFSGAVALLVLAAAGYAVMSEVRRLEASRAVGNAVTAMSLLNKATVEISFERSLSQVGLALPGPFPTPFRTLLDEQRRKSDALFGQLEAVLRDRDLPNEAAFAEGLSRYRSTLVSLRTTIDPDLARPIAQRQNDGTARIEQLKATVVALKDLTGLIRPSATGLPPEVASHDLLMQRAWIIREYGGRERTYFAIATALRAPIPASALPEMHESHGRVLQAWGLADSLMRRDPVAPAVRAAVDQLREGYFGRYAELRVRMLAAAATGQYPLDFESYFANSSEALDAAVKVVTVAGEANIALASELRRTSEINLVIIVLVSLLVLGATVWTVRYFLRHIAGRIVAITGVMRRLSEGQLDVDLTRFDTRDEVGDMVRALKVFRDNASARRRLELQAREDRDRELMRQDNLERLIGEFRTEIAKVEMVLREEMVALAGAATQLVDVGRTAAEHSRGAGDASTAADTYVRSVGEVAEDLLGSIDALATQAQETRSMVGTAAADAERSNANVQDLARAADRIGEVVDLIRSIAAQTNLLALNATIEAARAGEAGRGFSVVASEVKSLAGQTARATDEIAEQVAAIQATTRHAVDAIATIAATMHRISDATDELAGAVTSQEAATRSIGQSISHAMTGARATATALVAVQQAVGATNGEAGRVNTTARQVEAVSARLSAAVDGFLKGVSQDVSERRTTTRLPASDPVSIGMPFRHQPGRLVDICAKGIKVRCDGLPAFVTGDQVEVVWPDGTQVEAQVVWLAERDVGLRTIEAIDMVLARYAA